MKHILIIALTFLATEAAADLTASCTNPVGRSIGYYNETYFDDADSITSEFNFVVNGNSATVFYKLLDVITDSQKGLAITTDERVDIIIHDSKAIFVYSLYPLVQRLIYTVHANGPAYMSGGAMGKTMIATCYID